MSSPSGPADFEQMERGEKQNVFSPEVFVPLKQVDGTCYAYASTLAISHSMHRIIGRDEGYPTFQEIVAKIIARYGRYGGYTLGVAKDFGKQNRLHADKVDFLEEKKALQAGRLVIANFYLTNDEWDAFSQFFHTQSDSVLTKNDLLNKVISKEVKDVAFERKKMYMKEGQKRGGHSGVLHTYKNGKLKFVNSWGKDWGDRGHFTIDDENVLGQLDFIDVWWTLDDLLDSEKAAYEDYNRGQWCCSRLCSRGTFASDINKDLFDQYITPSI